VRTGLELVFGLFAILKNLMMLGGPITLIVGLFLNSPAAVATGVVITIAGFLIHLLVNARLARRHQAAAVEAVGFGRPLPSAAVQKRIAQESLRLTMRTDDDYLDVYRELVREWAAQSSPGGGRMGA
jgi:hypothetical protein